MMFFSLLTYEASRSPKGDYFSPFARRTNKEHPQTVKGGLSVKVFYVATRALNKKVLCPLNGCRSALASCRKGSGVLPAGRLVGLRDCTIRKAKGKNKINSSRMAATFFDSFYLFMFGSSARSAWRREP